MYAQTEKACAVALVSWLALLTVDDIVRCTSVCKAWREAISAGLNLSLLCAVRALPLDVRARVCAFLPPTNSFFRPSRVLDFSGVKCTVNDDTLASLLFDAAQTLHVLRLTGACAQKLDVYGDDVVEGVEGFTLEGLVCLLQGGPPTESEAEMRTRM